MGDWELLRKKRKKIEGPCRQVGRRGERNEKGKKKVGKICALNSPYWTLGGDKKKQKEKEN
jgi:hypothetical protein